jgi:hypothetical protein
VTVSRRGIVKVEGSSTFSEPYVATATSAKLIISGGGTLYTLKDTTSQFLKPNQRALPTVISIPTPWKAMYRLMNCG